MGAQAKGVYHSVISLFPVAMIPGSKYTGRLGLYRRAHIYLACCKWDMFSSESQVLRHLKHAALPDLCAMQWCVG